VTTNQPAQGTGAPARRWFPAGVADSQWLITLVLIAAAWAVMLTMAGGARVVQKGPLLLLPACVLIVVLARWSLPVLGVVAAAAAIAAGTGAPSLPIGALLGLSLYFSVVRLPRPKSIALAVGIAAALGGAIVYSDFTATHPQIAAELVENVVPLAGAWFIADSVAARRRYQAGLAAQAERERAADVREERVRIAREMHDVVAHALAVITVQAGVGRCLAGTRPQEAISALGSIETIGRTAQDELRVVLGLLRDEEAGTAPLAPPPRLVDVKDLADTVRASGVSVELRMAGTADQLSPSLELSIYRVAQEALTNVVKHAPGARATVELTVAAGKVRLDVRDDGGPGGGPDGRSGGGPGSRPPLAEPDAGHGIVGMRERIGAFGGWLVAGPVADGGFRVTAEVPVEGVPS
jgi:signal transduction histidine kinase